MNVGEHQTETNGIARFPCDSTALLLYLPMISEIKLCTILSFVVILSFVFFVYVCMCNVAVWQMKFIINGA